MGEGGGGRGAGYTPVPRRLAACVVAAAPPERAVSASTTGSTECCLWVVETRLPVQCPAPVKTHSLPCWNYCQAVRPQHMEEHTAAARRQNKLQATSAGRALYCRCMHITHRFHFLPTPTHPLQWQTNCYWRKEGNVGIGHMAKDHSDREEGRMHFMHSTHYTVSVSSFSYPPNTVTD